MKRYFYELDVFRTLAIGLMVLYHFLWNVNFFHVISLNMTTGIIGLSQEIIATMFILIMGICLTISYQNNKEAYTKHAMKRGAEIIMYAFIITVVSYIVFPGVYVFFGILHLIGLSIILAIPFIRGIYSNLIFGSTMILFGVCLQTHTFSLPYFVWLGFSSGIQTLDYFPLLPYFGVVLLGIGLGNRLYATKEPQKMPTSTTARIIHIIGKHSLRIYLLHLPVVFALAYGIRLMMH